MKVGLYSRETVAAFLGKKVEDIDRMIEEDGLPAVPVPGEKRGRNKFAATQLTAWLNKRCTPRWTVEDVKAELDACVPQQIDAEIDQVREKISEVRSLCDAAENSLRQGMRCPRVMQAIKDAVDELKLEGKAA